MSTEAIYSLLLKLNDTTPIALNYHSTAKSILNLRFTSRDLHDNWTNSDLKESICVNDVATQLAGVFFGSPVSESALRHLARSLSRYLGRLEAQLLEEALRADDDCTEEM